MLFCSIQFLHLFDLLPWKFYLHNISNWIEDLFWKQLDVTYQGMPDAMVTPLIKFLLLWATPWQWL
jgi:hypothetical protein